ncbi:MAG: glycerate dehydrogenase [Gammaproteobacteria bacterium]|nr:glycerate dehydrogenase [Gammaproteobacteria bacterium]MDH3448672.1 glycerate dehydrogenase [Gammaproteobacteria bacterium]
MTRKIVYPDADQSSAQFFSGSRLARLESLGEFRIYYGDQPGDAEIIERLHDADAAISGWGLGNAVLAALPGLEVISFSGLGVSTFIDLAEASRRNITVTHTLSAAETVAEHTLGLMLDAAHRISRLDRDLRKGLWTNDLWALDLRGKTLGLVGFGRIAQAVTPLAQALGMKVIAWTRNPSPERASGHGVVFTELEQLLRASDVVSLHLLSTPETDGLLDAGRLRLMQPGAMLVNTARSRLLDESALVELLQSGHIGSAGIDVFDNEPIAPDHPLLALDNVVLTPHVAYNTPEALAEMYDTVVDNLVAFYAGKPQNVATSPEI